MSRLFCTLTTNAKLSKEDARMDEYNFIMGTIIGIPSAIALFIVLIYLRRERKVGQEEDGLRRKNLEFVNSTPEVVPVIVFRRVWSCNCVIGHTVHVIPMERTIRDVLFRDVNLREFMQ